ncbi:hypothetical protein N0V82_008059 [Gnomoniopsis sp. IMI 355080]|nr:hypothetical protein N0V82_008059 [Gnomoniopsis sp. IMI 355080]
MSENISNSKHTPARRGRGGGRSRGRKNYASEGDALTEMPTPASFPATPMKSNNASPAPVSQQPNSRSTNRKNQRKPPRPSNVSDSPAPNAPSQRTPPPTDATPCVLPYAGSSSFHSPAPNTLPRPAFAKFTKSETFASTSAGQFSRVRAESVTVQGTKEPSPPPSDCEPPSPSQRGHKEVHPCDFLFEAEKEKIRRANSANAASRLDGPFSAPPGPQHLGLNDNPIPFALPSRPAQRGVSDNMGISATGTRSQTFGKPIHENFPPARPSQPQHLSPQPRPLQATQPYTQYHSPQAAPVQASHSYAQQHSPQATPPHAVHNYHFETPPKMDKSEQVKMMLGLSTTASQHRGPAPTPGSSNGSSTASSGSVPPSYPHLRGGFTGVPTGNPSSGGLDTRKILAEDALRKVLGLNLTLSMSSGLDGNRSPHGHYPGQA